MTLFSVFSLCLRGGDSELHFVASITPPFSSGVLVLPRLLPYAAQFMISMIILCCLSFIGTLEVSYAATRC